MRNTARRPETDAANFSSIKGAELFTMWFGESDKKIEARGLLGRTHALYICQSSRWQITEEGPDLQKGTILQKGQMLGISIPYSTINKGRSAWKAAQLDSIDVTVLCVDNVLMEECLQYIDQEEEEDEAELFGGTSLNIVIYDQADDARVPFEFTMPFYGDDAEKLACGWMEQPSDDWMYGGCTHSLYVVCLPFGHPRACGLLIGEHQTVFNLVEDLRTDATADMDHARALQLADVYLCFLGATFLMVTLYRIGDHKKLALLVFVCITLQIYADLEAILLGVMYCVISLCNTPSVASYAATSAQAATYAPLPAFCTPINTHIRTLLAMFLCLLRLAPRCTRTSGWARTSCWCPRLLYLFVTLPKHCIESAKCASWSTRPSAACWR